MKYDTIKYVYDFQQVQTIRPFRDNIYNGKITISEDDKKQSSLLSSILECNNKTRPKSKVDKEKNNSTYESANALYEGQKLTLYAFKSEKFSLKLTHGKGLKISSPNQMPQRLSIELAQVKAGNTSENLLNEIRQIIYSLYRAKEMTNEVYNNIMNSAKL